MKHNIKQRYLWLAPPVLATSALLACTDDRSIEAHTTTSTALACSGLGSGNWCPVRGTYRDADQRRSRACEQRSPGDVHDTRSNGTVRAGTGHRQISAPSRH